MTNSQWLTGISFPKFIKVVERTKVACNRFEGATLHAVALYHPGNFLTESGSVYKACKKKRTCIVLAH